nr:hypothetical protein [Microbispora catharanthi]
MAAFTPSGGLAEVAVAPAALTVPLPDDVTSHLGAAAPLMLTSALLLLTDAARLGAGESVLVHSASGGVVSAVARLVPALGGGRLIGTVGRPDKVGAARSAGYDMVVVPASRPRSGRGGPAGRSGDRDRRSVRGARGASTARRRPRQRKVRRPDRVNAAWNT